MNWLDVAGCPGAGKSTICDPIWHHKAIDWDGKLPPSSWRPFLDEMTTLFGLIRGHWSFAPAVRMNNRSVRKMATVARMNDDQYLMGDDQIATLIPYIQTGLVQRGLGFGWRLNQMGADVNLIRRYFWLMPVSIGVAFLEADDATIIARNNARKQVAATAHEDRAFMVPLMREPIRIAKEVLHERGVPGLELDVQSQTPDEARGHLLAFADNPPCDASALGFGCETPLLSPPPWWG
jgi:hypothetical protein